MLATYSVIETERGLKVVELKRGESAAAAAARHGGVIVDAAVYRRLQDAYDALFHLAHEEEDDAE